jgi:hypothetical protein
MDSVLVFGAKGCGFESRRGYSLSSFFTQSRRLPVRYTTEQDRVKEHSVNIPFLLYGIYTSLEQVHLTTTN